MAGKAIDALGMIIQVEGVSKTYLHAEQQKHVIALQDVSLSVQRNAFISIIGPSGCGKTTLLKAIAGLLDVDGGNIVVNDKLVDGPGHDRAMVFQDFALLPWATVLENIAFGLEVRGVGRTQRRETASALIRQMGLAGFETHYPRQLSGGMQQRVGLARALAVEPQILLMDEPFSALDAQTRRILQEELLLLYDQSDLTIVLVTHSIDEAVFLSDRILLMSRAPGTIEEAIDVPLPRPRPFDVERTEGFYETRAYLWNKLRTLNQPVNPS